MLVASQSTSSSAMSVVIYGTLPCGLSTPFFAEALSSAVTWCDVLDMVTTRRPIDNWQVPSAVWIIEQQNGVGVSPTGFKAAASDPDSLSFGMQ